MSSIPAACAEGLALTRSSSNVSAMGRSPDLAAARDQRLLDHIPLGVAAANHMSLRPGADEPTKCAGGVTIGERREGFEKFETRLIDGPRVRPALDASIVENQPLPEISLAGESRGHHRVPIVEHVDGLAQDPNDVGGERSGGILDVDTKQLQSPQQRGRVSDVEPLRRSCTAERSVIDLEGIVEFEQVQVPEGHVPPEMDREVTR